MSENEILKLDFNSNSASFIELLHNTEELG
jgi:hypothetical protein